MGYTYRPSKAKKISAKVDKNEKRYLKIIAITQAINFVIVIIAFFGFILIFGNINYVWGLFKPKEVYTENNNFKPSKPYITTDLEFTNKNQVDLEGSSEAGATITLFKNSIKEKETVVDNNNRFYFSDIEINATQDKTTEFYVTAKNKQGLVSDQSATLKITFDKKEPKFSIKEPTDGQTISSFSRTLQVIGSTEKDTEVLVNGRLAATNQDNEYSAQIRLEEGENIITVEVSDKAGNKSKQTVKVEYKKITED